MKYSLINMLLISTVALYTCNSYAASTDSSGAIILEAQTIDLSGSTPQAGSITINPQPFLLPLGNINLTAPGTPPSNSGNVLFPINIAMPNLWVSPPSPTVDSTYAGPVTNITPNYPSQFTYTYPNAIAPFDTLPNCPGSPKVMQVDGVAVPACPDINNNFMTTNGLVDVKVYEDLTGKKFKIKSVSPATILGAINTYCPRNCKTERLVVYEPGSTTKVQSVFNAVCPPGYAAEAAYKPEIDIFKPTVPITHPNRTANPPEPELTLDQLRFWQAKGYRCTLSTYSSPSPQTTIFRGCTYTMSGSASNYLTNIKNNRNVDTVYNGVVGQWRDYYLDDGGWSDSNSLSVSNLSDAWYGVHASAHQDSSYCYYTSAGLDRCQNPIAYWPQIGDSACPISNIYTVWLDYYFRRYTCVADANTNIYSDYATPTAYVCSQVKDVWQQTPGGLAPPSNVTLPPAGTPFSFTISGSLPGFAINPAPTPSTGTSGGSITSGTLVTGSGPPVAGSSSPISVTSTVGGGTITTSIPGSSTPGGNTQQQNTNAQSQLQTIVGSPSQLIYDLLNPPKQ